MHTTHFLLPPGFSPSLGLSEWSYSNNSATIELDAGEVRNFTLMPRQVLTTDGTYHMCLTASTVTGNRTIASLNITLFITNNQVINAQYPGLIPLSPGRVTVWNISVYGQGSRRCNSISRTFPKDCPYEHLSMEGWKYLSATERSSSMRSPQKKSS